jgi:hypothetical protein
MEKVKEIYFEKDSHFPTFVTESGEIKHPILGKDLNVSWQNDKQIEEIHHKYKNEHSALTAGSENKK